MRTALIFGISGQDGAYLARHLIDRGYAVHGTSRNTAQSFSRLRAVGVADKVEIHPIAPTNPDQVLDGIVKVAPDEIYYLAGQSSVGLSFEIPTETFGGIAVGVINVLEAVRRLRAPVKFFNAATSEMFGDADGPADETTRLRPVSPYAVAKASTFWITANYREAFGLFASSGILFNHESPLRPRHYATAKIVSNALDIAARPGRRLSLGDLSIERDWGWAPEYTDAMWRILQHDRAEDFVIGTGRARKLEDFVRLAFAEVGLDWREHVDIDRQLFRPLELRRTVAEPAKAKTLLGWEASVGFEELVRRLVDAARDTA